MEDTELLELAAKASGTGGGVWNPLTDDGDALRLAVKLGLQVTNRFGFAEVVVPGSRGDSGYVEADKGDSYAATRRAIVRAAAEVGLLKPPNDRVEGRDAALSRRVPSHDGLCPDGGEK